jgi:hypothetical protein
MWLLMRVPDLQRIIPLRFMLRCARDTKWQRSNFPHGEVVGGPMRHRPS